MEIEDELGGKKNKNTIKISKKRGRNSTVEDGDDITNKDIAAVVKVREEAKKKQAKKAKKAREESKKTTS